MSENDSTKILFACKHCGKQFEPSYGQQLKGFGFCTKSCATTYTNNHREYKKKPLADRFWAKVSKTDDDDSCWMWTSATQESGHGIIGINGENHGAHRVAWELQCGPITDGLYVCHKCDVPGCVRGSHLFLGTHQDNMADMVSKGRSHLGEAHGIAKMTNEKVISMRAKYATGQYSQHKLAEEFGIHVMTVNSIVRRKTWKHI